MEAEEKKLFARTTAAAAEVGGEQERGERSELPRLQQARPRVWFQPERLERKMKMN